MYNKSKEILVTEQMINEDMLEQLTLWADAEMAKQNEENSKERGSIENYNFLFFIFSIFVNSLFL